MSDSEQKPEQEIKVYSDVPTGSALTVATSPEEVRALALRQAGVIPPNELEFHCMNCGDSKSLRFSKDEMDALDGDLRLYTGPCWKCGYQTLRPKDSFTGGPTIMERHRQEKMADYKDQADVLVSRFKEEVVSTFLGGAPAGAAPPEVQEPAAPPGAQVDGLPDVDAVSVDGLTPR